jgi:hypothetical protein
VVAGGSRRTGRQPIHDGRTSYPYASRRAEGSATSFLVITGLILKACVVPSIERIPTRQATLQQTWMPSDGKNTSITLPIRVPCASKRASLSG